MKRIQVSLYVKFLLCLTFLVASVACEPGMDTGRYTYEVIYRVTGTLGSAVISVRDSDGNMDTSDPIDLSTSSPWTYSFNKGYGDDNPFIPLLMVEGAFNDTEYVFLTISWRDYKTDFTEELLAEKTFINNTGGILNRIVELSGPPLP